MRPSNGALALTAGLAVSVLLGPLVLRGDPAENARLDANRQRIAEMTEANRQRLLRNFESWQALSPSAQKHWREFVQQLDVNRSTLGPIVEDYYVWLQTIPGYRRDELRQATDVQVKVGLVREIAQEQLAARLDAPETAGEEWMNIGGRLEVPVLSSSELDVVLAAIEEGVSSADLEKLVDKQGVELLGVERHLMLFSLLTRFGGLRQLVDNPQQRRRIEEAVPERVLAFMERVRDRPPRGNPMAMILAMSVGLELDRAFRAHDPAPSDLMAFYDQMDPAEQEALLNLSADEFHDELVRRHFQEALVEKTEIDFERVQQFLGFVTEQRRRGGDGDRPGPGLGRVLPELGGGRPNFNRDDRPPNGEPSEEGARPPRGGDGRPGPGRFREGFRPEPGGERPSAREEPR